jgi:hypothetical protein
LPQAITVPSFFSAMLCSLPAEIRANDSLGTQLKTKLPHPQTTPGTEAFDADEAQMITRDSEAIRVAAQTDEQLLPIMARVVNSSLNAFVLFIKATSFSPLDSLWNYRQLYGYSNAYAIREARGLCSAFERFRSEPISVPKIFRPATAPRLARLVCSFCGIH